ncbi:hypothetical protein RQP46_010917 [Phenoliferia psychrophenolica]
MLLPILIATSLIASSLAAPTSSFSNHVLYSVSDPASEKYGQHWSAAEIAAFFAPKEETVNAVKAWLTDAGLASRRLRLTGGNQWLAVNVTIKEAEELLNARYELFEHRSGALRPATHSYSVPAYIVEHVDIITLTTIDCLKALYNFGDYEQKAISKNSYGIVEFTPNSHSPQDLDMFFKQYVPAAVGARPQTYFLDGGVVDPYPSASVINIESDLDLEYSMGIMYPMIPTLYQVGADGSFNNFLDAKLGAQGYTLLYSSGDAGVGGNTAGGLGFCINPATGEETPTEEGAGGTRFNPTFPSTCPYVTSVGATQTKAGADLVNSPETAEEACQTVIYSGGGFSNVFSIPEYQKEAIAAYYESIAPYYGSAVYNNSRAVRGYPDIAVNGANYAVSYAGNNGLVYGTSASSPVAGALFALINDARFAAGKSAIGFINPAIYSPAFEEGKGFNDITEGGNQGCGTPGFTAVRGWDPVTGLGTPNFGNLLPLFMELP